MSEITIRQITLADAWALPNIEALLDEYASESAIEGLPNPKPSYLHYRALEASGAVQALGAFQEALIVGVLVIIVYHNPHYSQLMGVIESLFVASRHRRGGTGQKLITAAEVLAKELGATAIFISAPIDGRLEKVMKRSRYKRTNTVFCRELI